jgi:hypothetical protein
MAMKRLSVMFVLAIFAVQIRALAAVDYAHDVLPILSAKCYHCHGPDEGAREKELRLDQKQGAFRTVEGVTPIVPGKPTESEVVRRITSSDPDEVMPPSDDIRKLTPAQIQTLTQWVEQGAKWGSHWAFVAPVKPAVPVLKHRAWPRSALDAFVLERLLRAKLEPAPEADKATLIRRVTFDLTGLPPTPAEIEAFIADQSSDAYEKLVDRLLASPRYGERMAAEWMDIARFADTHGYQMDRYRAIWPWRDWVIKSFNQNLSYDQFITWQIAGDLLPNATKEQRLATAFNRLHMQNEEGGIVPEEFRVAYNVDRVNTAGTAFLGLTMDCTRCHDHKYDPLTQRDYYSMFAFFQNIDESGQTSFFTEATPVPTLLLSSDEQDAKIAELAGGISEKEQRLSDIRAKAADDFDKWLATKGPSLPDLAPVTARVLTALANNAMLAAAQPPRAADAVEPPKRVAGRGDGDAAELSGENGLVFPGGVGAFTRADAFSMALWIQTPVLAPRMVIAHKSRAWLDAASRGYELILEDGRIAFGLHHMWPGNSLKVVTKTAVAANEWTHVAVSYDGSSRAAGVHIYLNGKPAEFEVVRDGLTKDITYGGSEPELAVGFRFRDNGFKDGKVDAFRIFGRAITAIEASRLAGHEDAFAAATRDELFDYFVSTTYAPARQAMQELASLRRAQNELITAIPEAMVMKELPQPKPAHVLKRGAYDAPGDEVSANTPGFLPPLANDQPRNRLGLARWMLDPSNPLTARVTVNRAWQQMFGKGIVETAENFGTQGSQPTHPELLDYLARDFADTMHWDMKRLLRTIALSATYRQSSHAPAERLAADPGNALLARGPSRRLTAEMIRDQALFDSGLLVEHLGGPSVKPYQPDGLWDVAMSDRNYAADQGDGAHRRSLYTFWKRTIPPPAMMVFDAADKSICAVRRQSTSTPLQALALLNDPQIVEAARFVSQRMLATGGSTLESRVAWAFQLITGRSANEKEQAVLKKLYAEQRDLFAADPDAAKKLLAVGQKRNDEKLDLADLAAGTVLGIALFSHDAAIMRR